MSPFINLLSIMLRQCVRIHYASLIVLVLTSACDELPPDDESLVSINPIEDISLYANTDAVIPIFSFITSPIKLKIECSPQPKLGYMEALSNGDFKYTPFIDTTGTEIVTFTVRNYATDEEVLPPQTLTINIQESANTMNCEHIPVLDLFAPQLSYYSNFIRIDPIENDEVCSGAYSLSVYRPSPTFMPHNGEAYVSTLKYPPYTQYIDYKPAGSTLTQDTIMYKIAYKDNPANVQYGLILISPGPCKIALRNDFGSLFTPGGSLIINLYENDDVCADETGPRVQFAKLPRHGTVEFHIYKEGPWAGDSDGPGYVLYQATSTEPWSYDSVVYKVCNSKGDCFTAKLIISAELNACETLAADDHVTYHDTSNSSVAIEVLTNDRLCGRNPKLSIKTPPQNGTIEIDERNHTFRYSPKYMLNDTFEYVVCTERSCKIARVFIVHK